MADVDMSVEETPLVEDIQDEEEEQDTSHQHQESSLKLRNRIRSIQAKLLALPAENVDGAGADDDSAQRRSRLLQQLEEAYLHASQSICLSVQEWQVWLQLHTARRLRLNRPLSPEELDETMALHVRATTETVGLHIPLFTALVSLVVGLYAQYAGVPTLAKSAALLELEEEDAPETYEFLSAWTGSTGPRLLNLVPGAYAPEGTAALALTAAQGQQAGLGAELDARIGEEAARSILRDAVSRSAGHLSESHYVWHFYKMFELTQLQADRSEARLQAAQHVYLARLKVPHQQIGDTFQKFSSFVTQMLPAKEYEGTMASANKSYSTATQTLARYQPFEDALQGANGTYYAGTSSAWVSYLANITEVQPAQHSKGKGKARPSALDSVDHEAALALFERCLAVFGLALTSTELEFVTAPPTREYERERKQRERKLGWKEQKGREEGDSGRWKQAESVWEDYVAFLSNAPSSYQTTLLPVLAQACKALPDSGLLHASYMLATATLRRPKTEAENIFHQALGSGLCASRGTSSLVKLLVGRVDVEREYAAITLLEEQQQRTDEGEGSSGLDLQAAHTALAASDTHWTEIYAILEYALSILNQHVSEGQPEKGKGKGKKTNDRPDPARMPDQDLTLQRYMTSWAERLGEAGAALVEPMWESTLEAQGGLHIRVWTEAAKFFTRNGDASRARTLYKQASGRRFPAWAQGDSSSSGSSGNDGMQALIQAKTALLQDWVFFEHTYGSTSDIQYASSRSKVEIAKLWENYYSRLASHSEVMHTEEQDVPLMTSGAYLTEENAAYESNGHTVEASHTHTSASNGKGKRKAEEDGVLDDNPDQSGSNDVLAETSTSMNAGKKSRTDLSHGDEAEPKRDREHSSVVIGNLPADATQTEVKALFSRCGPIQTITGPSVLADGTAAALIEFTSRAAVTGALTRAGKSLREDGDEEVSVSLGHDCTLYVTNFPEDTTDTDLRLRFGKYGPIFDVRWPSKKFAEKRRFAYIQYARADSAKAALVENGVKLSETTKLLVALSDPDRRKKRSDAKANLKELYVTGLPRVATVPEELKSLFERFGTVDDLRIPPAKGRDGRLLEGQIQGIAFVDMHSDLDAQRAMRELNSTTYRGKLLSVTLAAPRGASHVKPPPTHYERGSASDLKARTVIVRGLPLDAQDGLIQQTLETALGTPAGGSVKLVDWTPGEEGRGIARVELRDAAAAGKLLLIPDVKYDGAHSLAIAPQGTRGGAADPLSKTHRGVISSSDSGSVAMDQTPDGASSASQQNGSGPSASTASTSTFMTPRTARGRGRGRAGLGFARPSALLHQAPTAGSAPVPAAQSTSESMEVDAPTNASASTGQAKKKGQDDFRAMLRGA
ncbi:Splicing factor [Tilletia horrida]|nr:Splicing factor [Tilletia horrida]